MQGSILDEHIPNHNVSRVERTQSQGKTKSRKTKSTQDSRQEGTSYAELYSQNCPNRFTQNKKTKYHSEQQAKYYCLLLIQNLVRLCNFDIYAYSLMLQILVRLSFEGEFHTTCKIALTVFHLVSKFCTARGPRLQELILWSRCGVQIDEVIHCERQVLQGLNYELPLNWELNYDEIRALCFQYQTTIFQSYQ